MSLTARHRLLIWLLALLAGIWLAWHSRYSADMSFFLPARPSAEQQVLIDQLKEGVVSRLLMVAIAGEDAASRARASRQLRQQLKASGQFVAVHNGELTRLDADRDFLFKHRYQLSPAMTPARFSVDGLRAAISDSIDQLLSPAGLLLKPYLQRDPTGEFYTLISGLGGASQPAMREGVWASRDGERAMLLLQTRALGSDTDGQEAAIQRIRSSFDTLAGAPTGLQLQLSGPGLFAVKARASIRDEVEMLSLFSTLAIIGVLFAVYRSPRLIGLGLLPVASGALAGIVAVSLCFGTVFGITVGFGAALIGEAVDYSIYFFVQSARLGLGDWRQRFWPTIRLGVLTSVAGFAALLFSGFPGLAQLGLYALSGVATAALVTRFVLPDLAGHRFVLPDLRPAGELLARLASRLHGLRWPAIILAVIAGAYLVAERDRLWHPNLSVLSTVSATDAALDGALRADLAAPDARYMVVISADTREAALQAAEDAGQRLDRLVDAGIIGGYDSPARFLPSEAMQARRRQALPPTDELRQRLQAAQQDSPLPAQRLAPFLADAELARLAPALTRDDLSGSSLGLVVDSLLLQRPQGWSVLLPLRPGDTDLAIDIEQVRHTLAGSGALFVDMKGEFDALYANYLGEAVRLSLAGFAAIVLLLAINLRCWRRLLAVLQPLGLAVVLVIAGLHLAGEQLHLLHLVGMLLIIAVGSSYALFFDRAGILAGDDTLVSMAVANLTTAIGFGTLGLSSIPVLHAVGVTVGPGAFLALLLSAIFVPRGTRR